MKVLVISHNSFNHKNNMGQTLCRLFNNINKTDLAQLYFHKLSPAENICEDYYRITDEDAIKSIFFRFGCGNVIEEIASSDENIGSSKLGMKKNSLKLIIRDIIWKMSSWDNKKLNNWIKKISPDVIFLVPGYSKFIFDIALRISNRYKIPIVSYFTDDYYVENEKAKGLLEKINNRLLNKKIKKIVHVSKEIIYISDGMRKKYFNIFGKDGNVILTPYDQKNEEHPTVKSNMKIIYLGNIDLGRWETIKKIGLALNTTNANIILDVYSGCKDESIIKKISNINSINYKGYVDPSEINDLIIASDVVLHVESFNEQIVCKIKNSISTKIPNYLASNRYILAVGPGCLESIKYLKKNEAAYIIEEEKEIENKIKEYFLDNTLEKSYLENAKKLADENHNINKNSKRLADILQRCI